LFFGFAAVVEFFTTRDGEFTLGDAVPEINFGGDDGHALLGGLGLEFADLAAVEQQLAATERIVISETARKIFGYMAVHEPHLIAFGFGIGLADRTFPFAKAFDLCSKENQTGFHVLEQLIVVAGGAILRNNFHAFVLSLVVLRFHGEPSYLPQTICRKRHNREHFSIQVVGRNGFLRHSHDFQVSISGFPASKQAWADFFAAPC
jgi:hypothetical protein